MLLYYAIVTLHIIVCFILVLVVLLQSGRGADLAGAFGGGATQTAFGSRGPASFLSKMTSIAAIVFMVTSISLYILTSPGKTESKSILETAKKQAAKADNDRKKASAAQSVVPPTPEQINKKIEELEKAKAAGGAKPSPGKEAEQAPKPAEPKQPAK